MLAAPTSLPSARSRGRPLTETVAGWVRQASSLGPDDLLVLAGEEFAGPTKNLDRVLRRRRAGLPMETKEEKGALAVLTQVLPENVREVVLNRARVLHLPGSTGAGGLGALLAALMDFALTEPYGQRAVTTLSDLFHRQAGEALGSGIDEWVVALNDAGLETIATYAIVAPEERRSATDRYLGAARPARLIKRPQVFVLDDA